MGSARSFGKICAVIAAVGAVTALLGGVRAAWPVPNLAIVYLLVVILFAVTWGWWTALAAAVLAVLAYNFFFVEPIHTFTILDPQEWVELLVFLAVAAVTSILAARERARREEARLRAEEATLLYAVSSALGSRPLDQALAEVAELLRETLDLRGCAIFLADPDGQLRPRVSAGERERQGATAPAEWLLAPPRGADGRRRWIAVRRSGRRPERGGHDVSLRVHQRPVGSLRLVAGPEGLAPRSSRLLAAVAELLAAAIERERLRQAADDAELLRRTDELRSALLSSVSHDLRTPLAAIKASAGSLLQRDVAWSEADRQGFAEAIDREADRLDRLVRNLLDMSRIEGGVLRPRKEWYDLAELVREVAARLSPLLVQHPLELDLADDLPPIEIDYLMIDQVLTNLLENAARYTPSGTPLEITLERLGDEVGVSVVDHGPGVSLEVAGQIFEKFQRATGPDNPPGSGLGLAVSRGFVEAHGGELQLRPTPGGGATFSFSLPLPAARPVPNEPDPTHSLAGRRS